MRTLCRLGLACAMVSGVSLQSPWSAWAQEALRGFPVGLICLRDGAVSIAYLSQITAEGAATYLSRGSRFGFTITAEEPSKPKVEAAEGSECIGKTLETFRAEGRAIEP